MYLMYRRIWFVVDVLSRGYLVPYKYSRQRRKDSINLHTAKGIDLDMWGWQLGIVRSHSYQWDERYRERIIDKIRNSCLPMKP